MRQAPLGTKASILHNLIHQRNAMCKTVWLVVEPASLQNLSHESR